MASGCISSCVDDTGRRRLIRATYINLYKWPESDAEFVKSVSSNGRRSSGGGGGNPRVVDSVSCRQLYLRSYTFSRKESVPQRTKKCLDRVRKRVVVVHRRNKACRGGGGGGGRLRKYVVIRRAKEVSCAAFLFIFRRLLSCTTKVDVVG